MDKEYKSLKIITAAAIYDAGDKDSSCFKKGFQAFLKWAHKHYTETLYTQDQFHFFLPVGFSAVREQFSEHPEWEKFLIKKGFIEKISKPKFYEIGDKFMHIVGHRSCKYILAVVSLHHVQLIARNGLQHYGSPTEVNDVHHITEAEFSSIAKGSPGLFAKEEDQK